PCSVPILFPYTTRFRSSFLLSCGIFAEVYAARQAGESATFIQPVFEWITAGSLNVSLSFMVDPLSAIMLLIITGIGFLIRVYSRSEVHTSELQSREHRV